MGCDLCNNWFHGDCVGITEEMCKTLSEFVCTECRHARDTQELYCLCKQPYDESQYVMIIINLYCYIDYFFDNIFLTKLTFLFV